MLKHQHFLSDMLYLHFSQCFHAEFAVK